MLVRLRPLASDAEQSEIEVTEEIFLVGRAPLKGIIKKIVHVELKHDQAVVTTEVAPRHQGYGVVRGEDGCDVFFVDTAVQDVNFADLQTGQQVCYHVEDGPLMRAKSLTVPTGDHTTSAPANHQTNCSTRKAVMS